MNEADIEKMFPWGPKELKETRKGARYVRAISRPSQKSLDLFRAHKMALMTEGVVLSEFPEGSGKKRLAWFQFVSAADMERRRQTAAMAESTNSGIFVPCPPGLEYRPFQRAFVHFVLNGMGVDMSSVISGTAPHPQAFRGMFGLPMIPTENRRTGYLLGDQMGLGKSVQAVALVNGINWIAGGKKVGKILYVCPAYLKENTVREWSRWLTERYTIGIADGSCFPSTDIVVINYQIAHKYHATKLAQMWDIVFIDEAQNLRNEDARQTRCLIGFRGNKREPSVAPLPAKVRIAMSGTPAVNKVAELWTILNWLDPVTWGNKWRFENRYCGATTNMDGIRDTRGSSNEEELQNLLKATLMIRRLKKDVLKELPPKVRQIVSFQNPGKKFAFDSEKLQAWAHRMAMARAGVEWAKTRDNPIAYETALQTLQDAVDSGAAATSEIRMETAKLKLPLIIPYLQEARDTCGKIIVCAYHRFVIEQIAAAFPGDSMVIYGGIDTSERQRLVDRFQNNPACKVAILSISTAVGMTLTAASDVFFAEEDWIPGVIAQAEDRAHRIGQNDTVNVYHLVLKGSIDEVMADQVMRKQERLDRVFDVNEEKGREAMEPIIPIGGFSATIREIGAQVKQVVGREMEIKAAVEEKLRGENATSDQLLMERFLKTEAPWPKLVALMSLLVGSRSTVAGKPIAKVEATVPTQTPVVAPALPKNTGSQGELFSA